MGRNHLPPIRRIFTKPYELPVESLTHETRGKPTHRMCSSTSLKKRKLKKRVHIYSSAQNNTVKKQSMPAKMM